MYELRISASSARLLFMTPKRMSGKRLDAIRSEISFALSVIFRRKFIFRPPGEVVAYSYRVYDIWAVVVKGAGRKCVSL
ncbi:hypothetical protein JCM16814_11830 [Desulfobaculum senezii]